MKSQPCRSVALLLALAWVPLCGAAETEPVVGTVASADGVTIEYEVQGLGETVLVFVHCWCCDRTYWKNQLPHFAKKHKVVAIDLAGHGGSGLNRKTWGPDAYADDVKAVVDALKLDKMILIGHSMGGPVVVEAATRLAGRVQAIIAVDTLLDVDRKPDPKETGPFLESMRADFVGTTNNFIRGMMFPEGADPQLVDEIANDMAKGPTEVGIASMEGMLKHDLATSVERAKVPIYCINSDKFPTDAEAGKRHAAVFEVEILKGAGHFLQLEKPAEFNQLLEKTINKIVARSGDSG